MTTTRDGARAIPAPAATGRRAAADDPADATLLAEIAHAIREVRLGRFDVRLPGRDGVVGEVVDEFNALVALQERRNRDLLRISRVVGREGRMLERLNEESYDGA